MTLFGVSTLDHLLRQAGFEGKRLLYAGFVGPLLNVPFKLLLAATLASRVALLVR